MDKVNNLESSFKQLHQNKNVTSLPADFSNSVMKAVYAFESEAKVLEYNLKVLYRFCVTGAAASLLAMFLMKSQVNEENTLDQLSFNNSISTYVADVMLEEL